MVMLDFKRQFALILAMATVLMEGGIWYPVLFHRKHRLIRVRGISSLFTTSGMWSVTAICWNLAVAFDWPCLATAVILQYMHVTVGFFFFEKFCMILINFSINQEAVNYVLDHAAPTVGNARASLTAKPSKKITSPFSSKWSKWIFNHRMYFTAQWNSPSKLFTAALVFVYSSVAAVVLGLHASDPGCPFGSNSCYDVLMMWWRSALISGGFACLLVLLSAIKFIKVKESFFLKQELFLYCFIGVFALVVFSYRSLAPRSILQYYDQTIHLYGLIFLFFGAVGNKLIWIFLLNKVRKELPLRAKMCNDPPASTGGGGGLSSFDSVPNTPRENRLDNFKKLLEDDIERNRFREFLITEFAVENLLFWEEVETLLRMQSPTDQCAKFVQIYQDFCSEESKLTVNLSSIQFESIKSIVKQIHEASADQSTLQALAHKLQDPMRKAQREIEMLMLQDSYRRFQRYLKDKALSRQPSMSSLNSTPDTSPHRPSGTTVGTDPTLAVGSHYEGFPVRELQI
eukprot:TRINITY_DN5986_c0_g1_i1.p2 TRINITY_DN5986_c0_g1~~TRINITY_DN5986_c0_g1_i1.p2  ORF type:complete len:514 (+),score=107.19 TRINITY_DN5986_c0_g1_i1:163-1704(+)